MPSTYVTTRGYPGFVLHHTVDRRSSSTDYSLANPDGYYDFMVFGPGSSQGDGAHKAGPVSGRSRGAHAIGCNCSFLGIGVQGCFGASVAGEPDHCYDESGENFMTQYQEWGVATVLAKTEIQGYGPVSLFDGKLVPHMDCIIRARAGNPSCPNEGNAIAKDCCGARYASPAAAPSDNYLTTAGLQLRSRIMGKATAIRAGEWDGSPEV